MQNNIFSAKGVLISSFFVLFIYAFNASAQFSQSFVPSGATIAAKRAAVRNFANPILKTPNDGCAMSNLRAERFASEMTTSERAKLCLAVERVTNKLNSTDWSPALLDELKNVWQAFSIETVNLRSMPKAMSSRILAMAQPFPDKTDARIFSAAVYIRTEKSGEAAFFQLLLHELRHVYDFHETWRTQTALASLEIERRAFLLMSKLTEETPEKEKFSGVPKLWKESWSDLPEIEIAQKREAAIQKYLRGKKLYRDFAQNADRQKLDFSYLKSSAQSENRRFDGANLRKDGERLPTHQILPPTAAVLPQNIRETSLNLEKPKNPRDEKEILRVALKNEKKLYYGMSNFVYDQKLAFQCLKEGKVAAAFAENHTVTRTEKGDALFKLTSAPAALPCVLSYRDLETDFTNTFWASPALEKMPIYFMGFTEVEGKTLAQYSVSQPDAKSFDEMAREYPQIKPFRVPVGTIYVSPEDGQIVRFAGTSFPEENVTGDYARQVHCTYYVKAVRQKINIDNGLWVTVHVGTVAVASVKGKFLPFNYTVNFENYRQATSDVKVLDDDQILAANYVK